MRRTKSVLVTVIAAFCGASVVACIARAADFNPGVFPGPTESLNDYNETILQLALGDEINFPGYVFRMHYSTMSPGGMIREHDHAGRPCIEYVLGGTATETKKTGKDGKAVVKVVAKGETEYSTVEVIHWWKNQSKEMAKIMAVDIKKAEGDLNKTIVSRPQGDPRTEPLQPPTSEDQIKTEELDNHDLSEQFPELAEAKNYVFRSRRLTLLPKQKTKLEDGTGNPSITFVVQGEVWENRSDQASLIRRQGEYSVASKGVTYYWENTTIDPVVLWVVDILRKDQK
jgi:quercetin dioxygenase-like cupin family protein